MPVNNDGPTSGDNYKSDDEDKKRARVLGVIYVILAIVLAWMLFKIWPPTQWPSDQALNDPQVIKNLKDCECFPTPTPTPTPSPTSTPSPQSSAATTASSPANSPSVNPTASPSATRTTTPTPTPSPSPSPSAAPTGGGGSQTGSQSGAASEALGNLPISFFWGYWCLRTSFDERLILLVIVAGMLGSFVHAATSLADFRGNNNFNRNWTWFYMLRPVIGMSLALVFYFVVRGGFLTTSGGAKDINPYGIAALAGMVGMFSKQATDKLSEVFGTLFRAKPGEGDDKRSGSLHPSAKAITIAGVEPKGLTAANSAGQTITVTGTNFVNGSKVSLEGGTPATTTALATTFADANKLTATVGAQNLPAQTYKLKIVNPDGTESPKVDFIVA